LFPPYHTIKLVRKEEIMKFTCSLLASLLVSSATAFTNSNSKSAVSTRLHETKADLEVLAQELNPIVKYWDPLDLVNAGYWGFDQERTIGWLRQAEIKHGRVAMAAFVGYCVQSSFHWPWAMTLAGDKFPSTDLTPPDQWDALPFESKSQIILFVGFLEAYSELTPGEDTGFTGQTHYTKGGIPGKFPTFDDVPHPVPYNLYDPFELSKDMDEETKARRLKAEINNGRLAMLGIFGFLSEQTIPGSVPVLKGLVGEYSGNVMDPFGV